MFKVMDRVRTVRGREDALWYPDAATMLFAYAMGTPTSVAAGQNGTMVGTTVQDGHRQALVQFGAAEDGCVLLDEAGHTALERAHVMVAGCYPSAAASFAIMAAALRVSLCRPVWITDGSRPGMPVCGKTLAWYDEHLQDLIEATGGPRRYAREDSQTIEFSIAA